MPWKLIYALIGPGLHWNKPRHVFLRAIEEAERRGRQDVAEHLRIMLELRDAVTFETPTQDPFQYPDPLQPPQEPPLPAQCPPGPRSLVGRAK